MGEISYYTVDGENALWIGDDSESIERCAQKIMDLIARPEDWRKMRAAAVKVWREKILYSEDILAASNELIAEIEGL